MAWEGWNKMKRSEMLKIINNLYGQYHEDEYYPSFCEELLNCIENHGMQPPARMYDPDRDGNDKMSGIFANKELNWWEEE